MPPSRHPLSCTRRAASSLLLLLTASAQAQQHVEHGLAPDRDPANLAGERVSPPALADTLPLNHGAPALAQLLKKLRTRASLMMIVAHPDDEDGGMLTFESRGLGARVAMLTLNRGEGGQNLMSADFNDALGLIRTQELLAADRYMGVDQMFGSVIDFGFSKTREEALQQWGHDRVLYDAVRAVRLYRPLVLTSVFVGGVTDGHGQHQVAGQMNQEVFTAAADPNVFPDMGLPPWAPLKVYARVPFFRVSKDGMYDYATGKTTPPHFHNYVSGQDIDREPTATIQIHEGDPALGFDGKPALGMEGKTYIQFARLGLAFQKSQIGANVRLAPAGAFDAGYTRMATRLHQAPEIESSLFDGIDTTLPGIATLAPAAPATLRPTLETIDASIVKAQQLFDPAHPELTTPPLAEAFRTLATLLTSIEKQNFDPTQKFNLLHELRIKRVQLNNALLLAQGIDSSATLSGVPFLLTDASSAKVTLSLHSGDSSLLLTNLGLSLKDAIGTSTDHLGNLPAQSTKEFLRELPIAKPLPATRPYFSRTNLAQPFYDLSEPAFRNAPVAPPSIVTSIEASAEHGSPTPWERLSIVPNVASPQPSLPLQPAVIVPPVSVSLSPAVGIIRPGQRTLTVQACLSTQQQTAQHGALQLEVPAGWQVTPANAAWSLSASTPSVTIPLTLSLPPVPSGTTFKLTARATTAGQTYTEGYRPVGYPGLTYTNFYIPATFRAAAVDVQTAPNLKIAYLPGTGDEVAAFLPNLGITPTILTLADLTPGALKPYDAVLLGVRAYAAHPELANSAPLLAYAAAGGVVIVQYNTTKYADAQSPYPIKVPGDSAHNVVVEAQPVTILAPTSPVLNWPNKITSADFNGWVEEYGHGFAATWDPHFQPLVEVHDPEQDPQRGGLLYAQIGRGAYLYVAFALYRQLPEGVPGAYRLLANLLSLSRNPSSSLQTPAP